MIDKTSYISSRLQGEFNSAGNMHTYCPFHDDRHASFSITEEGLFICGGLSCGERGNFYKFYKLIEGLTWAETFKRLEVKEVSLNLRKYLEKEDITPEEVVNEFPEPPFVEPINSIQYLYEPGLGEDIIQYFGLMYGKEGTFSGISVNNSIICPIFDLDRRYRTFQVRYLSPLIDKRWMNPKNSPNQDLLYGGWLVNDRSKYLWVVEGASDVWSMFNSQLQSVGLFTKEATAGQFNRLFELCVKFQLIPVICMDGDVDKSSILSLVNNLSAFGIDTKVVYLEPDEDPGSLSPERMLDIKGSIGDTGWM